MSGPRRACFVMTADAELTEASLAKVYVSCCDSEGRTFSRTFRMRVDLAEHEPDRLLALFSRALAREL